MSKRGKHFNRCSKFAFECFDGLNATLFVVCFSTFHKPSSTQQAARTAGGQTAEHETEQDPEKVIVLVFHKKQENSKPLVTE